MNCINCGKPLNEDFLFCPYCGVRQKDANPFEVPAPKAKDDPWAVGGSAYGGPSAASTPKSGGKKNKAVFLVMTVVVAALVVFGCVINFTAGSGGYDQVLDSYFAYSESDSAGAIEALWHPAVLRRAIEDYGRGVALDYLDGMAPNRGLELERWRESGSQDYSYSLPDFNEEYGANATRLTEVWVDVYYADDTEGFYIITLVEEDGVWYLVDIY